MDYCNVFISCLDSHSDGTHSLQRIHWSASDVMLHFSKKQTHLHLRWPEGESILVLGWTIPLNDFSCCICQNIHFAHQKCASGVISYLEKICTFSKTAYLSKLSYIIHHICHIWACKCLVVSVCWLKRCDVRAKGSQVWIYGILEVIVTPRFHLTTGDVYVDLHLSVVESR